MTVWLALDNVDRENGCMQVIPGSHLDGGFSSYRGVDAEINTFRREITDIDVSQAVPFELRRGECSLHDGRIRHGADPNRSNRRRLGYSVRYLSAGVSLVPEKNEAHPTWLARGRAVVPDQARERLGPAFATKPSAVRAAPKRRRCPTGRTMTKSELLTGHYKREHPPLPAVALAAGPGLLSAVGNDYDFETGEEVILGFDVGATKTAAALGTTSGAILEEVVQPSPSGGEFEAMWKVICALGDRLIGGGTIPAAIGVSIGGPLDPNEGVIYAPPNLPGWGSVPLRKLLEYRFGLPSYIEHDAKAGALAEWLFGAGQGCKNLVFLTFGTGLGAGLIIDGRLCRGRGDVGEVGHWRMAKEGPAAYGKSGSWEAFSSGAGLARLAHWRYPGHWPADLDARALVQLARGGDAAARSITDEAATMLGQGISYLVDLLSPEAVVLGSLAVRAGDLFLPIAQQVVDNECLGSNLPCPVVAAALGERIGPTAALCAAIYQRSGLSK